MTVPDAILQSLLRIPADVPSVRGSERIAVRVERMQQPLCELAVLDTVALLVANAKQLANNHLKVTILYTQISARRQDWRVAVSGPFCVEIKTLSPIKSTKSMMSSRRKRYILNT